MSGGTYTAGPWKAQMDRGNAQRSCIYADGNLIAQCFDRSNADAEANARLIAAAPDLLAALELLLAAKDTKLVDAHWLAATAAVAAAKGW